MEQAPETNRVAAAAGYLRAQLGAQAQARFGIVLGSGLGGFVSRISAAASIAYSDIPHFPQSRVPGHAGRLVAGLVENVPVLTLEGRVHGYEGYSAEPVVFGVRTLAALGVKTLVLTNAAGAIRLNLHRGQLVLIADHINLSGMNPAAGPLYGEGPRFFDMSEAYSRRLRELAHSAARSLGQSLSEGVYISVPGPSFETPAEIRAFRVLGADLVGMSTVLEAIAARQAGIEVLGISCVSNMAAGVVDGVLSHEEVMETGRAVESRLAALLARFVAQAAGAPAVS